MKAKLTFGAGVRVVLLLGSLSMAWAVAVTIDGSQEYQTMDGLGVAEAWNTPDSTFYPYLFDDLDISILRFRIAPELEPLNDNNDPNVIDWNNIDLSILTSFNPNPAAHGGSLRDLLREAKNRGIKIMGTIYSPPAWMKTNDSTKNGGQVISGYENEFAEYVVIWISTLKDYYGIEMDYISLQNEPDVTEVWETCTYTASSLNNFIKVVGARFASENITTKILGPETGWFGSFTNSQGTARADVICGDPVTKGYVDALATHSYGQTYNNPDSLIYGWLPIKSLANSCNKKLWMTEYCNTSGNATWLNAFNMAQHIHNAITYADVTAYICWEFFDAPQPIILKDQTTTYRYHMQKQYIKHIRPGSVRIDVQSGNNDVCVSAFSHKQNNTLTIVAINRNASSQTADFDVQNINNLR